MVGGAEFRQAVLARALAAAGCDVSAITQDFGQPANQVIDGVRVIKTYMPQGGIPVLRYFHPRLTSVLHGLREARADIYYQSSASYLTAVVAWHCRRAGAHSVYSGASDTDFTHGQERMQYLRDRLLFRWGVGHVDAIIAQTARQVALVQKHYGRDACIVPGAYALPSRKRKQLRDLVLWVGGIRRIKRPERFLALARALPQYRFRMIGGPVGDSAEGAAYYDSIRALAADVENLEFMGFRPLDEVELHFDEARVFVNTSEIEGFPNTFLQAWARGIPTVSYFDAGTSAGGTRPFLWVTDEAQARTEIVQLLSEHVAWDALSQACTRHFSDKHSVDRVVSLCLTLFRDLAARSA